MSLKQINGRVISYCEIPEELIPNWLKEFPTGCYVEVHLDTLDGVGLLDIWFKENYPGIEDETFYIEIDY